MPTLTTPVRDRLVTARGLPFHLREWGEPGGPAPAVLLLHGLTGNAWEWDPIASALAHEHHVIALDQRGHGDSARADDYAAAEMAQDLAALVPALGLERPAIVGHSMGGVNGLLLAAAHPELVSRLAIVDIGPQSLAPDVGDAWAASLHAAAHATYATPEEAHAEWRARNPRAREQELMHFIVHNLRRGDDGRWRWRFDAAKLASFFTPAPTEQALWDALARVACPALVVRGRHSGVLSARTAARMADTLPDGRLVELADGAHDLTVEQPGALTDALAWFLAP